MSWRQAFRRQASSENAVRLILNDPRVADSHRLHYLQMVTEKLAKSFLIRPDDTSPPPKSHKAFTRLLQTLKSIPYIQRKLGFERPAQFKAFIDSLLTLADRVERLAPNFAGVVEPNPEYPWWNPTTRQVFVPCDHTFEFLHPTQPQMIKLEKLVTTLLRETD